VLGVERVDHGIRTLEDPALVQYMADNKVPITLCPLSNSRLQVSCSAAAGSTAAGSTAAGSTAAYPAAAHQGLVVA
jgi:cytosine/adenosine deaminase-related metal-dependent hydrolase